jgi:hypothetical protein
MELPQYLPNRIELNHTHNYLLIEWYDNETNTETILYHSRDAEAGVGVCRITYTHNGDIDTVTFLL